MASGVATTTSDPSFNFECLTLVWVDSHLDKDKDKDSSLKQCFRQRITTNVKTFNDPIVCLRWLRSTSSTEIIFLVVSGDFAKRCLADLNQFQLKSIFIYIYPEYSGVYIEQMPNYDKIRINTCETEKLIDILVKDRSYVENVETSKSLICFKARTYSALVGQVDNSFVFFKVLLEILISTSYFSCSISSQSLIDFVRQSNSLELTYDKSKLIHYFVSDGPLVRLVNKALRDQNISMLFYFRFFLIDIQEQLRNNNNNEQFSSIVVYRKQLMNKQTLENLSRGIGFFYLMFNEFLLTSKEKQINVNDNIQRQDNNEYATVILEINATNVNANVLFGSIDDNNVLFMCGSIFQMKSLSKQSDDIYKIDLVLEQTDKLQRLNVELTNLRESKDLFLIENLFNGNQQSDQISIFYQCLLQQLDKHDPLSMKIHDRLIMNTKIQPIGLTNAKVYVVHIFANLNSLSKLMLNSLEMLTNNTIRICNNLSEIDFSQRLILLTNNEILKSIEERLTPTSKYFLFEENDQSQQLIFKFAQELYDNYLWESEQDARNGQIQLAQQKKSLAKQIPIELKKIYRNNHFEIRKPMILDPSIDLFWLKFDKKSNEYISKCRNLLDGIIENIYEFDNPHDCYLYLCTNVNEHLIYLIIDDNYHDTDIASIHQLKSIQQIFRYQQSNANQHSFIQNFVLLSLIHKLLKHFSHLIDLYETNKDQSNREKTLVKTNKLSKLILQIQNLE